MSGQVCRCGRKLISRHAADGRIVTSSIHTRSHLCETQEAPVDHRQNRAGEAPSALMAPAAEGDLPDGPPAGCPEVN
jgi:hypothetical protein